MSGKYDAARERFLRGELSWSDGTIKAVLVTAAYTPDFEADEFLSDVLVGARVAMSNALEDKSTTGGWASAPLIIWDAVTGAQCTALVFVDDTGDPATTPLIAYLNDDVTNLPLSPNGAKVTFIAHADTGFFRL